MRRHPFDFVAVAAALLALAMLAAYTAIMRQQDDGPAGWVVVVLAVGALGAAYGSVTGAPYRRAALVVAAVVLAGLGLLAILSIGLPILLASGLCLVAALRRPDDSAT